MKHTLLTLLLLLFITLQSFSQNQLPLDWTLTFDSAPAEQHKINLLLSWERQGVFDQDGKGCLSCNFSVNAPYRNEPLVLKVGLQCNVEKIFINDIYIGGNIPEHFWSQRNRISEYILPKGCLKRSGKNHIRIYLSALSYTGGISHNSCTLTPQNIYKPTPEVSIRMLPTDHLFTTSAPAINVHYKVIAKGTLHLQINNAFHRRILDRTFKVSPHDSVLNINLKKELPDPGFYECIAQVTENGNTGDVEWLAYRPEQIKCTQHTPEDFRAFWQSTLSELKKVNPQFRMHKDEKLSRGKRDGYVVEMQSLGNITIRGYYFKPRKAGRFPVILHVPGYGQGFENQDNLINGSDDVTELALCVRGHGISADVFNPGFGIPGIWGYKLNNREENAYRGIYMDCVRAIDFLYSRLETDTARVGVCGGSQGGGLTLATAGLCGKRIAACAYFDPFLCDLHDFFNIRTLCKKQIIGFLNHYNNPCSYEEALAIQELIDTKGFASWITCPVYFTTALFDDDCPPHVGFAAYNSITTPKEFRIYPHDSHLGESGPYGALSEWLKKKFGL